MRSSSDHVMHCQLQYYVLNLLLQLPGLSFLQQVLAKQKHFPRFVFVLRSIVHINVLYIGIPIVTVE